MSRFNELLTDPAAEGQVQVARAGWVGTIALNRPDSYNCYSTGMLARLKQAFDGLAGDDAIAAIVYTAAGHSAFCTGGDVKEYEREYCKRPFDYDKYMKLFREYIESITQCPKPVIARLNGMAVGGGNESQLACDLSAAGEHIFVAQVGTSVGSVACGGSTQWLPIAAGERIAREILLLNKRYSSWQALNLGLVNVVAPTVKGPDGSFRTILKAREGYLAHWNWDPFEPPFERRATTDEVKKALAGRDGYSIDLSALDAAVASIAAEIVEKFPECTRFTKRQVGFWKDLAWSSTIGSCADWLSVHYYSEETKEGMRAFVEKRKANYTGVRERLKDGAR